MIKKFKEYISESNFAYRPEKSNDPVAEPINAKYKSFRDVLAKHDSAAEIEEEGPYDTTRGRIVEITKPVTWKYLTKVGKYKYRKHIGGGAYLPKKKEYYTVGIECKIGNDVVLKGGFGEYYEMDEYFYRYTSIDSGKLTPKTEVDFYLDERPNWNSKLLTAVSRDDNRVLARVFIQDASDL